MSTLSVTELLPTDRLFDATCVLLFGLFLFNEFVKFRSDSKTKERLDQKETDSLVAEYTNEEDNKPISIGKEGTTAAGFPFAKFLLIVSFAAVAYEYSGESLR